MYNSTRWWATLGNPGKPYLDTTLKANRSPGGAGWYTGVTYMNVYCADGGYSLVRQPVSGVVWLASTFDRNAAFATIDPAFHAIPPNLGTVLLDAAVHGVQTIRIDTTTLTNGRHSLFLRTDAVGKAPAGIGSGVLVLNFEVRN